MYPPSPASSLSVYSSSESCPSSSRAVKSSTRRLALSARFWVHRRISSSVRVSPPPVCRWAPSFLPRRPSSGRFARRALAAAGFRRYPYSRAEVAPGWRCSAARFTRRIHAPRKESAEHRACAKLKKPCQASSACSPEAPREPNRHKRLACGERWHAASALHSARGRPTAEGASTLEPIA